MAPAAACCALLCPAVLGRRCPCWLVLQLGPARPGWLAPRRSSFLRLLRLQVRAAVLAAAAGASSRQTWAAAAAAAIAAAAALTVWQWPAQCPKDERTRARIRQAVSERVASLPSHLNQAPMVQQLCRTCTLDGSDFLDNTAAGAADLHMLTAGTGTDFERSCLWHLIPRSPSTLQKQSAAPDTACTAAGCHGAGLIHSLAAWRLSLLVHTSCRGIFGCRLTTSHQVALFATP